MALLTDELTMEVDVIPLLVDDVNIMVDVFSNRLSDDVQLDVMIDTLLQDDTRTIVLVAGADLESELGAGVIKPAGTVTFS